MVVFEDGLPRKSEYRRFTIKSFEGQDDVRAMHEVLTRRFRRYLAETARRGEALLPGDLDGDDADGGDSVGNVNGGDIDSGEIERSDINADGIDGGVPAGPRPRQIGVRGLVRLLRPLLAFGAPPR